jgi:PIN domain nuclease of toxin-antitoxin system
MYSRSMCGNLLVGPRANPQLGEPQLPLPPHNPVLRMRLLLDSNALIRWHAGTLRAKAVRTIRRSDSVFASAVSSWEIAIRASLGALRFEGSRADVIAENGFEEFVVSAHHGDLRRALPLHHADLFDRLIVQALEQGLTILTSDRAFEPCGVPVRWIDA